jgi:hypothetical protein
MQLNLKRVVDPTVPFYLNLYGSTLKALQHICDAEGIKMTHLIRHACNEVIDAYNASHPITPDTKD